MNLFEKERGYTPCQMISGGDDYHRKRRVTPMRYAIRRGKYADVWDHQWNVEIDNRIFHLFIDRDEEKVIIRGRVDYLDEREEVEHIIKMRMPSNYMIVNEINL